MKGDPFIRKALRISLVLHGLAVCALVVSLFWSRLFSDPPPEHVFQLMALAEPAPTDQIQSPPQPPQQQPQVEPLELPDLPQLDQREVKIPEPEPEPLPPRPEPPPVQREQPKKPPPPQQLNYNDFLKENKLPDKPRQAQPRPRPTVSAPKIDISDIQRELNQSLSAADSARVSQMSQAAQSQLFDYMSRVRAMLDAAFIRPDNLPYQRYEALVQFKVERNGQISSVNLMRSSGNPSFDNAVLAAFRRTRLPPTPDGQTYLWKIPFEVRER